VFGDDFSITETRAVSVQTDLFGNAVADGRTTLSVEVQDIYEAPTPVDIKNIHTIEHDYILADTFEKRADLISILKQQKHFCFDTETTGTDANQCELVGLSFAVKHNQAWYVPVPVEEAGDHKNSR
jgi:DNA polymerase-1